MNTPSSCSSEAPLFPGETRPALPPNLADWLAFGRRLASPAREDTPRARRGIRLGHHGQPVVSPGGAAELPRPLLIFLVVLATAAMLRADSLWKDDAGPALVADKKALAVGDLLTIVVSENTSNSKSTSTKTAKNSATDTSLSTFLYAPAASSFLTKGGTLPALKFDSKNSFEGGGQIANSETITTRVTVRVMDVLPNRNLVIERTRHTASSGEFQDIVLRGVVRADDVQANNTVFSYNIADATIRIISKGSVSDAQKRGWFTKFWEKVTPF